MAKGESPLPGDWERENIKRLLQVEQIESGLASKINSVFNIHNFSRYEPTMLVDMFHSIEDKTRKPYELSFKGTSAHNGALSSPKRARRIQKKLKKHDTRYEEYEVADVDDIFPVAAFAMARRIQLVSEVKHVTFDMHGKATRMMLSEQVNGTLDASNVGKLGMLETALSEDASFLLASCSTGLETDYSEVCIASSIANALGRTGIAPNKPLVIAPYIPAASNLEIKAETQAWRGAARVLLPVGVINTGICTAELMKVSDTVHQAAFLGALALSLTAGAIPFILRSNGNKALQTFSPDE